MNALAIDTSGNHLTVLLLKGDSVYKSHLSNALLKHSITLMPEIEKVLEETNTPLSEIDVFCSAIGPGSFTGIRIGVSTIKALAYATGKKVLGVTSFLSLAYNSDESKVLAVIDAKHDNFYVCGFENKKVTIPPCFLSLSEVKSLANGYTIVCDGDIDISCVKADYESGFYKAVKESLSLASYDLESLLPLYVKKSQAEEEHNG